jgi:hypothetical protein
MFHYYTNNAKLRLQMLPEMFPKVLPLFPEVKNWSPRHSWGHLQNNLDLAVGNYVNWLDQG